MQSAYEPHLDPSDQPLQRPFGRFGSWHMRIKSLILAWLVLANFAVFGQSLGFEFLSWDDKSFVLPHLERFGGLSWESVRWSFENAENGWLTPLPYLSLFLDAELYGIDPVGFHLTNFLLHTASTLLLFAVLCRMTEGAERQSSHCADERGHSVRASNTEYRQCLICGFAATLFAIHPLHVEPVVWVTCRWELLYGFFWIVGMWIYTRYCAVPTRIGYAALLLAYICSILSKPMALTFPFALLLLDYWPLGRFGADASSDTRFCRVGLRRAIAEKWPLFVVMVAAAVVTWIAKSSYVASHGIFHFSWPEMLMNAAQTYAIFAVQTFFPTKLSFFYVHPSLTNGFDPRIVAAAVLLLAVVTAIALRYARTHRYLLVGWLWYLGVLVPAIGLVQVEHHARADRYTYIPLIGLSMMLCWGVGYARRQRRLVTMTSLGWIAGLMFLATCQASHWRDSRSLFAHGVRVDETNFKAWFNLGHLSASVGDFRHAEKCYEIGNAIYADDYVAVNNFGMIKFQLEDFAGALTQLERLSSVDQDLTGHHLRTICLAKLGRSDEALQHARSMIERFPQSPSSYAALARVFCSRGEFDLAADQYRLALAQDPGRAAFAIRLSQTLVEDDQPSAAVDVLEEYLEHSPESAKVANQLCWLLATHEQKDVRDGPKAVRIAHELCVATGFKNCTLLDTLSVAYAETGQFEEASATIRKAIEIAERADDRARRAEMVCRLKGYQDGRPHRVTREASSEPGGTD